MSEKERKPWQFQPGQSGNPGGREKGAERRANDAAASREYKASDGRTYRGKEALLHVLLDIALDQSEKARDRVSAVNAFLDRADGKPKQAVDVSTTLDAGQIALLEALRMTPHERRGYLAKVDAEDAAELARFEASQDSTRDD